MIENLNTSIFKLAVLTSLSSLSSFSQTSMQISNHFSLYNSKFSHLLHPVLIHHSLSIVSFDSCLFANIQTTAIQTSDTDFIHKRIIFQFDGCIVNKNIINITKCIFKYCISHYCSGCFNLRDSSAFVEYNIFSSNRGKCGGAFHCFSMDHFTLNQNLFNKNVADYFGAAYIENKLFESTQNNFTHNYGAKWVGALELYSYKKKTSILYFMIFDHNSAKQCAAYLDLSAYPSYHNIDFALFKNNSAKRRGGSITDFTHQMGANYSNCVFIGNSCIEGNCIYIETKKSLVMLFNCFFDCPKEKAFYLNWKQFPGSESIIICNDDVVFAKENKDDLIEKNLLSIMNQIPPVKKLKWFIQAT